MEFEIGDYVAPLHKADTFEVEINTYSGDADAYHQLVVRSFIRGQDEDALESLIGTLQRMKEKYPYGRGGDWDRYNYQDVEGFNSWFGESYATSEAEYLTNYSHSSLPYEVFAPHRELSRRIGEYFEWPWDVVVQDGLESTPRSWKVFYYSDDLKQFEVSILDD